MNKSKAVVLTMNCARPPAIGSLDRCCCAEEFCVLGAADTTPLDDSYCLAPVDLCMENKWALWCFFGGILLAMISVVLLVNSVALHHKVRTPKTIVVGLTRGIYNLNALENICHLIILSKTGSTKPVAYIHAHAVSSTYSRCFQVHACRQELFSGLYVDRFTALYIRGRLCVTSTNLEHSYFSIICPADTTMIVFLGLPCRPLTRPKRR